jgi:DNA repair protein RadC
VETLAVIALDAAGRLLDHELVAAGAVSHVAVSPGEVFRPAMVARARSIVLAHNHPSGNVRPSPEDLAFTRRMVQAAELLGVDLIDHVIVARRAFFSFWEGGLIRSCRPPYWKAS